MRQEKTYCVSEKAHLHERLQKLPRTWGKRPKRKRVILDSFIVSATPYEELRSYYGDGEWSKEGFSSAHILFFDNEGLYVRELFGNT